MPTSSEVRERRLRARRVVKTRERARRHERDLRDAAHRAVKNAKARGELVSPLWCERCGLVDPHLHGHHHDYTKPLEVEWVCRECHEDEHGRPIPPFPAAGV